VIDDYLRRQDGVVTLAQAMRAGLSAHSVQRRVRAGRWRRCSPGVFFADDRPFTPAARIRAVVWGRGPQAVASGLAAAWWLGLIGTAPDTVEVTVPRNSHGRAARGYRVRRRDLSTADIIEFRRLRVTAFPLTVLEAAVRRGGGPAVLDTALQRRVSLADLTAAHLRNDGRYGAAAAGRMLCAAAGGARSEAERLTAQLLRSAGITGWHSNFPVGRYSVDFAFPEQRVAIEIDGFAFHSDHSAFQNDRVRQNWLALQGWQILRFTWLDITQHPQRVLAEIREAISAR
jgi:very-short-patch-repair endonuclease